MYKQLITTVRTMRTSLHRGSLAQFTDAPRRRPTLILTMAATTVTPTTTDLDSGSTMGRVSSGGVGSMAADSMVGPASTAGAASVGAGATREKAAPHRTPFLAPAQTAPILF